MRHLSQRDPKWAYIPLGLSRVTTIGSHGCTITCLAMMADTTPDDVNRRMLQAQAYANTNLVIWYKINRALPSLNWTLRSTTYNHSFVVRAIRDYGACMVEVDFDGTGRGDNRHWVLYIEGGMLIDPWTGTVEPQSKYPVRTGFAVIQKLKEQPKTEPPTIPPIEDLDMASDEAVREVASAIDKLRRAQKWTALGLRVKKKGGEYYIVNSAGKVVKKYGDPDSFTNDGWDWLDAEA